MTHTELLPTQKINPPCAVPAIALRNVTKLYRRTEGRAITLKESLITSLSRREQSNLVVALDDVSLEIARGEAFGLIGPNGSGKSTMLKLIAGITTPTTGEVRTNGRVLGLIELGAGFHPELSGEENIRLQGAIYGLDARQIEDRMETILDFAQLGDFRHLSVKHYSSGMFVRLGFAIAVHAHPDVLLVDEVIAVGDQEFQERCLSEIRRLRDAGMTLVLVTHFPEQAERICQRAAWLGEGKIQRIGPAAEILADHHQNMIATRYGQSQGPLTGHVFTSGIPGRFGTGEARVEYFRILDAEGRPCASFRRGQTIVLEIDFSTQPGIQAVDCVITLDALDGTLLTLWRAEREAGLGRSQNGTGRFRVEIVDPPLLAGRYRLTVSLSPPGRTAEPYNILYKLHHFTIELNPDWETLAPIELKPVIKNL